MMYRYEPVIEVTPDGRWRWGLWGRPFTIADPAALPLELIADGKADSVSVAMADCSLAVLHHRMRQEHEFAPVRKDTDTPAIPWSMDEFRKRLGR